MRRRRAAVLTALVVLTATACSEPEPSDPITESMCTLEGLTSLSASHPRCLYFTGTDHYRNERWADAVASWTAVLALGDLPREDAKLRIDSLNNLGYMYFFGFGIGEDKPRALAYWTDAVAMGHRESEYHLCHAYADRQQPTYDPQKARQHCGRAEAFYEAISDPDPEELNILEGIREYQSQLVAETLVPRPG